MNKQNKELLLQLLIEQYQGEKKAEPKTAVGTLQRKKRNLGRHTWTPEQKAALIQWHNQGASIIEIARRLNLRRSQAENMLYSILNKRAGNQ